MRILGIDPGTATTGYAVIQREGGNLVHICSGVIRTSAVSPMPDRLAAIHDRVLELISEHSPDVLATERLFFSNNVNTAFQVGGAIGVVLLAAAKCGLAWSEYRPNEVKMAVVGYGAADKKQVQYMVARLLNLKAAPKPDDAADALAIAICHANSLRMGAAAD
ncbi:MAG: crossover junction endodeoxyribonuclease RuvC [Armatimonadetes bacterium]|nr:crossover junction endodeoxyribonuclease RuvC [Armatimonadota bacterium]MDE2206186.1 crossover junction endodeoxyribonuclease RuvC [Armatimonadota bacterium]